MDAGDGRSVIQALPTVDPEHRAPLSDTVIAAAAAAAADPSAPSSSYRVTRSLAAPEWTTLEMLSLVNEVAAVDEGWSRSVSSFQKWILVAENVVVSVGKRRRTSSQCKRRWEALVEDYAAVRRWEGRNGVGAYWKLGLEERMKASLPGEMNEEVYSAMDAVIKVEEARLGISVDADVPIEVVAREEAAVPGEGTMLNDAEDAGGDDLEHDHIGRACNEPDMEVQRRPDESQLMAHRKCASQLFQKLQQNADHLHSVLLVQEGSASCSSAPLDLTLPCMRESATRKAYELSNTFDDLVSNLNQFLDLINDAGFKSLVAVD